MQTANASCAMRQLGRGPMRRRASGPTHLAVSFVSPFCAGCQVEYTFHYSHRSGNDYLVSVERLVAADSEMVGWYYRWRKTASGSPWVDWNPLGIPPTAVLDEATARAKELVSRLW